VEDMYIDTCPEEIWNGQNLGKIYQRLRAYLEIGGEQGATSEEKKVTFDNVPKPLRDEADFVLHMLHEYDRQFHWYTTTANQRPDTLKKLLFHEHTLPGFNDSGAHLTNMAYYDGNLLTLKMEAEDSIELVSKAVKRLTTAPAKLFNLDVGALRIGDTADMVLINPEELLNYDSLANTRM